MTQPGDAHYAEIIAVISRRTSTRQLLTTKETP